MGKEWEIKKDENGTSLIVPFYPADSWRFFSNVPDFDSNVASRANPSANNLVRKIDTSFPPEC